MGNVHKSRIRKVRSLLRETGKNASLIASSAPVVNRTRNIPYPYRQDSDFYYLTGIQEPGFVLVLNSKHAEPLLLSKKLTEHEKVWEGGRGDFYSYAESLGAEAVECKSISSELWRLIRGTERIYFQNIPGTVSWETAQKCIELPSYRRRHYFPAEYFHIDAVLSELRAVKDRSEVRAIKKAARISSEVLLEVIPSLKAGESELDIAKRIAQNFRERGALPAFQGTVASGFHTATIHHSAGERKLKRGDWVLFDCGAEDSLYCSDMSRMIPVGKNFSEIQRELYQIVCRGLESAIRRVKPGANLRTISRNVDRTLIQGLIDIGVLRGNVATHEAKGTIREFMPHPLSHSVGLDVHDVGWAALHAGTPLKEGMVLTIEPGLYFQKKTGKIPRCGLRLEDLVVVTADGCEVLTSDLPKKIEDVEALRA